MKYKIKLSDGQYLKGTCQHGTNHYVIKVGKDHAALFELAEAKRMASKIVGSTVEKAE